MVEKSSKRGGYESDGGYESEESQKENTRPRNPRRNPKRKSDQLKENSTADNRNSGDWKYSHKMKYNHDWLQKQKAWFRSARYEADEKLKKSDKKSWKKMKTKRLEDQIKELDN